MSNETNFPNNSNHPQSANIPVESLAPFTRFCCTLGMIPASYKASMTYEEQLMWLCDYLENTVIPTVNNNTDVTNEMQGLYNELHDYVEHYFDNLDVQQEINNKLDEMATDGTLISIVAPYLQPFIDEQNQTINNAITQQNQIIENQNNTVANLQNLVYASTNINPLIASSTAGMTDTTRIYVNTTDGYWYFYNGSEWTRGGVYQSTSLQTDITLSRNGMAADGFATGSIKRKTSGIDLEYNLFDGNYTNNSILTDGTFKENTSVDNRTAIIKIEPNKKYYVEKYDTSSRWRIATYQNFPKEADIGSLKEDYATHFHYEFTAGNNENYLVIFVSNSAENVKLCVTDTNQDRFIDYNVANFKPIEEIQTLKASLSDTIIFNLFDGNFITNKGVLYTIVDEQYHISYNYSGGASQKSGTFKTAIIKCQPNERYFIKAFGTHNCFRVGVSSTYPVAGDDLELIKINKPNEEIPDEYSFITPENANYIAICINATTINDCQLSVTKNHYVDKLLTKNDYILLDNFLDRNYYVLDSIVENYFTPDTVPGGSVNDTVNLVNSQPSVITDIYEELVTNYPNIVSKTQLGTASGYTIYQYNFSFPTIENTSNYNIKKLKVGVNAGIHGYEQGSCWCLAQFMKLLTTTNDNEILNKLKANFDFSIVPVANPYGFAHNQRKNENGVDINRNFDANFVPGADPSSDYYAGTTPGSEPETQALMKFIENNTDAITILDFHNITNGYPLFYSDSQMSTTLANAVFTSLSRMWVEKYHVTNRLYGRVTASSNQGTFAWYALSVKKVNSFTMETPYTMPNIGAIKYDRNTIRTAIDILANTIIALIKNFLRDF